MKISPTYHRTTWLFIVSVILITSGCTGTSPAQDSERLAVVATTSIVGDVVTQVAGDFVTLKVLLPTGADPHAFEPKPADIAAIADADIVFANGVGLETFMESTLNNAGGEARLIEVSEGIELLKIFELHEEEAHDEHGEYDPHVWHDPWNIMIWTDNISKALSEIDPIHAEEYQRNAEIYIDSLKKLDKRIQKIVEEIPLENRLLVSDHLTFGYFAQRYGFQVVQAIIPGFSTLASPSARDLAALQDQIQRENIRAILVGKSVNPALAEQIAKDTGVKLVPVYTGALSAPGEPGDTYIRMMEYNAQAIANALK